MTPYQYWLGKLLLVMAGCLVDRVSTYTIKQIIVRKLEHMENELDNIERKGS